MTADNRSIFQLYVSVCFLGIKLVLKWFLLFSLKMWPSQFALQQPREGSSYSNKCLDHIYTTFFWKTKRCHFTKVAIACIVNLHPQFCQRNKYFIMFFPSWVRFASMIDWRQNLTHSMMIVATLRYRYYPLTCSSEGWRRGGRTTARRWGWGWAESATWSLGHSVSWWWSAVT